MKHFSNFITQTDMTAIHRLECLRGAYFHNECSKCIDICPHNAIYYRQKKIHIDESKCLDCGGCVGVCPTSAITTSKFDMSKFLDEFRSDGITPISCDGTFLCIGVFDRYELLTLALRNSKRVIFSISKCSTCEHRDGVYDFFIKELDIANALLEVLQKDKIEISSDQNRSKREIYNRLINRFQTSLKKPDKSIVKHSIKKLDRLVAELDVLDCAKEIDIKKYHLFGNKEADSSCNGCGECVVFCPTGALESYKSEDEFTLYFTSSKCISCGICKQTCTQNALKTPNSLKVDELKSQKILFSGEYVRCKDCKCGFLTLSKEVEICSKCLNGREHTKNLFKLASEL